MPVRPPKASSPARPARRLALSAMALACAALVVAGSGCASVAPARLRAHRYNFMALRAHERGDSTAALLLCSQAVAVDPTYSEAWLSQGIIAQETARPGAAADLFREALFHDPSNARARTRLASELLRLNDPRAAWEEGRRAIADDPGFAAAYFILGVACERLGDKPAAAACYLKGLALEPEAAEFFERLAGLATTA